MKEGAKVVELFMEAERKSSIDKKTKSTIPTASHDSHEMNYPSESTSSISHLTFKP